MVRKDRAHLALEGNKNSSRPKELYGNCIEAAKALLIQPDSA